MSEEKTRFTLRIDSEVLEKVKKSAKFNRRSAAMEIEHALAAYYSIKTSKSEDIIQLLMKKEKEYYEAMLKDINKSTVSQ